MFYSSGVLLIFISVTIGVRSLTDNVADVEAYYECARGFQLIGKKCYHFSTSRSDWFKAFDGCTKVGRGNLTVLSEALDMRNLADYFSQNRSRTLGHDKKSYWVASIKNWKQNKWIWYTSGKSINFPDAVANDQTNMEWVCLTVDGTKKRYTAKKCFDPDYYICQSEPIVSISLNVCKGKKCAKKFRDRRISFDKCMSKAHLATLTEKQRQRCQNLLRKSRKSYPGGWMNDSWDNGTFDPNVPQPVIKRDKPTESPHQIKTEPTETNSVLVCPYNWILLGKKCYKFSTELRTWNGAYESCKKYKSKLAIIKSQAQDNLIKMYLNGFQDRQERWLGGRYNDRKNLWIWAKTGEMIKYESFSSYALENRNSISQWYGLTMDPRFDYDWSCADIMEKKLYICQVKAYAVKQLFSPRKIKPQATIIIDKF